MYQKVRPAIDGAIAPEQGVTKDGQPLSYNRAPAPDLAPWISRLYVAKVAAPIDYAVQCGLFDDTAFLRIQLAGLWEAETASGRVEAGNAALFFGPQSRRMPIRVTGSFISLGLAFRPGACTALAGPRLSDHLDRLSSTDVVAIPPDRIMAALEPGADPETWLLALEAILRERVVNRDFGMPPKQVLRRARALDMASYLRGVADRDEADEMALRYYDESHLIHEFTELFGMPPRQFAQTPQPILTLTLESRQARRLEALQRLQPGQARPWQ